MQEKGLTCVFDREELQWFNHRITSHALLESPDCPVWPQRFQSEQRKSKSWCFLTLQASEVLQDREQSPKVEQKQEDPRADAKIYEEQMAKVVFLEEQIKNLREEQELLW